MRRVDQDNGSCNELTGQGITTRTMSGHLDVDPYDVCEGLEKVIVYFQDKTQIETAKEFKYVTSNIPHGQTPLEDFESQLCGCACKSACSDSCSCISRFGPNYSADHRILSKLLTESSVKPMTECNTRCSCDNACVNRLVQFGVHIKLQVFKTPDRGFGLRSLENIKQFSFICEYAGEVLTAAEAQERLNGLRADDMNYLFVLKEHFASGTTNTCIDPKYTGNIGRFLNHSCDPNLVMVPVRVNNNVPKLALFAICDIPALHELTYNYGGHTGDKQSVDTSDLIKKPCLCGSTNCKGYLPFDPNVLR